MRSNATVQQVEQAIDAVMAVNPDQLETLVQRAHECDVFQIEEPAEPFTVSRQAIRMLWMFRRNLESVTVRSEAE